MEQCCTGGAIDVFWNYQNAQKSIDNNGRTPVIPADTTDATIRSGMINCPHLLTFYMQK